MDFGYITHEEILVDHLVTVISLRLKTFASNVITSISRLALKLPLFQATVDDADFLGPEVSEHEGYSAHREEAHVIVKQNVVRLADAEVAHVIRPLLKRTKHLWSRILFIADFIKDNVLSSLGNASCKELGGSIAHSWDVPLCVNDSEVWRILLDQCKRIVCLNQV